MFETVKEKQKKSYFKGVLTGVILLVILLIAYQVLIIPKVVQKTKETVNTNMENKYGKKVTYYVVNRAIEKGSVIDIKSDITEEETFSTLLPIDAVTNKDDLVNKINTIDLKKGSPLFSSIFIDRNNYIPDDLKYQDFTQIVLNNKLKIGDFVDVRLKRADGSDDVVLSKKEVLDINNNRVFLYITDYERTLINYATVEAALYKGTLYTTVYVDATNQQAAEITYKINSNIADIINKDNSVINNSTNTLSNNLQSNNQDNSKSSNNSNKIIEGGN